MGTDRYAYSSRLKEVDPIPKLWFSLTVLLVCLFSESISVGLVTALVMGVLTVRLGGQRPETVLHFLKIPLAFLVIGCATIVLRPISEETEALCAFHLLGQFRWGITVGYLQMGLMVFCKAVGAISAMYFLSLNTPVTDLTMALGRLHVPRLLVELMELIYRFIFVLMDTAGRIRVAQESRLGYQGFRQSLECVGTMLSLVFLRAWRQGDRVYAALEARGYTGSLVTLPMEYQNGKKLYFWGIGVVALQLLVFFAESGVLK